MPAVVKRKIVRDRKTDAHLPCVMCGARYPLPDAVHIIDEKEWKQRVGCDRQSNGIPLCPNCHRVSGRKTTTITHYGRKTGQRHQVTIWFALDGDKVYIGTANVNRHWVRNVQKTTKIKLSIGGENFDGNATLSF